MRRSLTLLAVIALTLAAAPADVAKRAKSPRLKAFKSCAGLISYARHHAPKPVAVPRQVPVSGGGEDDS